MRVTFDMTFRNGIADIERAAAAMARAQREVASGRRVGVPSDDPSAAAQVIGEAAEQRALDSYDRATDSAESRLMVTDSVLADILLRLEDAQVKTAAASNSFTTAQQREALALEIEGIRDALLTAVNQQFRGTSIFAGTALTTAPFAKDAAGVVGPYQGNAAAQQLDVDRSRAVDVTFDGGAMAGDLFDSLAQLVSAVRAGNTSGPGFSTADGLARLRAAHERVTTVQSRVGNALNAVDEQQARLAERTRSSKARRSSLEDANMAEAIVEMQQAKTAHEAALGAVAAASRQSLLDYLK